MNMYSVFYKETPNIYLITGSKFVKYLYYIIVLFFTNLLPLLKHIVCYHKKYSECIFAICQENVFGNHSVFVKNIRYL